MEFWINEKGLVSKGEWERKIEELKEKAEGEIDDEGECADLIRFSLIRAVKKRLQKQKFGVFFSGGVDSSLLALIAKQLGASFVCYTAGFEFAGLKKPDDAVFAEKAADELGFELRLKLFNISEAEKIIEKAVRILKEVNLAEAVHVGVAAVIIAANELAREDNVKTFFGGLGAEEIFAGYLRHTKVKDVQAECWRGLREMWGKDLVRDAALGRALGINVLTPYLEQELILNAMRVPAKYKIDSGNRKIILRKVAEQIGLAKEVAWRKKQAAQYGSSFDKAMEKLAKKNGFKNKTEYLNSI